MHVARYCSLIFAVLLLVLTPICVSADGGGTQATFGQDFFLENGDRLDGDLAVIGGRTYLKQGSILDGDVVKTAFAPGIYGNFGRDVVVLGGSVSLADSCVIEGDLVTFDGIRRDPGAEIRGDLVDAAELGKSLKYLPSVIMGASGTLRQFPEPVAPRLGREGWGARVLRALATIAILLAVAALAVVLLPDAVEQITGAMAGSALVSFGVGLLTILLSLLLLPLLVVICIGMPVAVVLALALMVGGLVAWVAAGKLIGERLLRALHGGEQAPLVQALVGVSLISALAQVRCVGPIFSILVLSWGLGAIVLTRFGMTAYPLELDQAGDGEGRSGQDHRKDTRRLVVSPGDWSDVENPSL